MVISDREALKREGRHLTRALTQPLSVWDAWAYRTRLTEVERLLRKGFDANGNVKPPPTNVFP